MKNKQTIQDVDARMRELIIRIARDGAELNDLRVKRKLMVTGKIKVPPPPGVKVRAPRPRINTFLQQLNQQLNDEIPSFLDRRPKV
jgi:hypothetical protein